MDKYMSVKIQKNKKDFYSPLATNTYTKETGKL